MYIKKLNTHFEEDNLYSIIDRVDNIKKNFDLMSALKEIKNYYGLKNLSYAGFKMGEVTVDTPIVATTYQEDWIKEYRQKNYFALDPVLRIIPKAVLPSDWQSFDLNTIRLRKFFAEAQEAGVGEHGISIPVRGRHGDISMFSLTSNENERDWLAFKRQYLRDFQVIATHFHQAALITADISRPNYNLSHRELEVLYWAACGKTAEEIGLILNITKRGVRFHISTIIEKMDCTNMAHAVAKGVYFNFIKHPR